MKEEEKTKRKIYKEVNKKFNDMVWYKKASELLENCDSFQRWLYEKSKGY